MVGKSRELLAKAHRAVRTLAGTLLAVGLFSTAPAEPTGQKLGELKVIRITPRGDDVVPGHKIVIEFDRAVVSAEQMGRKHQKIPVEISPRLDCQWRWLNPRSLACQLGEDGAMEPATRYNLTIEPGLKPISGAGLKNALSHSFVTERPAVIHYSFHTWRSPGIPVIQVVFNQPVYRHSLEAHLFFEDVRRPGSRIPGVVTAKLPREDNNLQQGDDRAAKRSWFIRPKNELSLDATLHLIMEPGVVSSKGPEVSQFRRVVVAFDSFPKFQFLGLRCTVPGKDGWALLGTDTKFAAQPRCDAQGSFTLAFSTPVTTESVKQHLRLDPNLMDGHSIHASNDPWANIYDYSSLNQAHQHGREYLVWLPQVLASYQTYRLLLQGQLIDVFGRDLGDPARLSFMTEHRRPDITLVHPTSVLEKNVDSDISLSVTNIDSVTLDYQRLTTDSVESGLRKTLAVPKTEDTVFSLPLGVREMLGGRSGVVSGSLSATQPASYGTSYRTSYKKGQSVIAQVTPYHVHAKLGHYNTLVWVTDLVTGNPVSGADVQILKGTLTPLKVVSMAIPSATTSADGVAQLPGSAVLDPGLQRIQVGDSAKTRLFVRVEKGQDIALLPLDQNFHDRIPGAVSMRVHGHIRAWGTTAQGGYRPGDIIQYKIYVRDEKNDTLIAAPKEKYAIEIQDPTGKVVSEIKDITLSQFGSYSGEHAIPESSVPGWYRIRLKASFTDHTWVPIRVLVDEFSPPPFKVLTELNSKQFYPGGVMAVATTASLHAGEPYANAPALVNIELQNRPFISKHAEAKNFTFDSAVRGVKRQQTLMNIESKVDNHGQLLTRLALSETGIQYGKLLVESSVRDDRGKSVTDSVSAQFLTRDRFVGLRTTQWLYQQETAASVEYIVVDTNGVPIADVPVSVKLERQVIQTARVKGAGNAYVTQHTPVWLEVLDCKGLSQARASHCEFVPTRPGAYRFTAIIKDTQGRKHSTQLSAFVAGPGVVDWLEDPDERLGIIPESLDLQVGDKARFLVQNPLPGALALITMERYGVIDHWVQKLEGSTPVIELPIKPEHIPGFHLSVTVMSPRVHSPSHQSERSKPRYRMGSVELQVNDPYKQIDIDISTNKKIYRPGETAKVRFKAVPRHPKANEPIEIAVVVLDEVVFNRLQEGRSDFNPYKGFYELKGLDVTNYNLLKDLVGQIRLEKKGANSGGVGKAPRSVLNNVSYWNPSVRVGAKNQTQIEFEIPDKLTAWRIFAMAVTPTDRMGLGSHRFKVNRPTEIRPIMPNQVLNGDSFTAGFTIVNRSAMHRTLKVSLTANGALEPATLPIKLSRTVRVGPYQREMVQVPLQAKGSGDVTITAAVWDKNDGDKLVQKVPVKQRRSLRTESTYGTLGLGGTAKSIVFPKRIHPKVGSVNLVLSPSVVGHIEGVFRSMRDYPYHSWEQVLSKSVVAAQYNVLRDQLSEDFAWPGSDSLVEESMTRAAEYQAPNGGMSFWIARDQYVSPYLSAYTALAFNWLKSQGEDVPSTIEKDLHDYLQDNLRNDVVPSFYTRGMTSTVHAVTLAALAEQDRVSRSDLERFRPYVAEMSLFGKAHYLAAARQVKGAEHVVRDVVAKIFDSVNENSGKLQFKERLDDGFTRILSTSLRAQCAILSSFILNDRLLPGITSDVPEKLVRFIIAARGNQDHWKNTQEDLFCVKALLDYRRQYEQTPPQISVRAYLDDTPLGDAGFQDLRSAPVNLQHLITAKDPGRTADLRIEREGQGRLYYTARLRYAPTGTVAKSVNAGIEVHREYSVERDGQWHLLEKPMKLMRGESVRVDLYISLPTARNFVVVEDPVPGGLEPVERDLVMAARVDMGKGKFKAARDSWWHQHDDWVHFNISRWSFYHKELEPDAVRYYADYLGSGNYHLSYAAKAIANGTFTVAPIKAVEMYNPDVYGKGVLSRLTISTSTISR